MISLSFQLENCYRLFSNGEPVTPEISAGNVETILYHTSLRWMSKIKEVKEAFFNLFCFSWVFCLLLFLRLRSLQVKERKCHNFTELSEL